MDEFIKFEETSIDLNILFFQFCIWLYIHMKHCIIETMARPEILKKKVLRTSSSIECICRLDFCKEQNLQSSIKALMGLYLSKQ